MELQEEIYFFLSLKVFLHFFVINFKIPKSVRKYLLLSINDEFLENLINDFLTIQDRKIQNLAKSSPLMEDETCQKY